MSNGTEQLLLDEIDKLKKQNHHLRESLISTQESVNSWIESYKQEVLLNMKYKKALELITLDDSNEDNMVCQFYTDLKDIAKEALSD